jgi:hypothetical protein
LTVTEGHDVAKEVRHQVLHRVPHASGVTVHVDPVTERGEAFHHIESHAHDGLPFHEHQLLVIHLVHSVRLTSAGG